MKPPPIAPLIDTGSPRPFWSVMIPVFWPKERYLRKAIESVLRQCDTTANFQVEVVDDCSPDSEIPALVRSIGGDNVAYSRTSRNLGLAGCWNTCIERARGEWVHILHQDDYVLPGFYEKLAEAFRRHPNVALVAARSFSVDKDDVITGVSPRVRELEHGSRAPPVYFDSAPFRCPGVTVRRSAYEAHGGFLKELRFVLDLEMWARVVGAAGGLVTPDVLACHRKHAESETVHLMRSGETLQDYERLHHLFAQRYKDFNPRKAAAMVCSLAWRQAATYKERGEAVAAKAYLDYWRRNVPLHRRLFKHASVWLRARLANP